MGKILDFLFVDNWEEYQRIQLYKKVGDSLSKKEIKDILKKEKLKC